MLHELKDKKEEFKDSFAQFNANNEQAQAKAIEKLKENGIKFKKLQDRLDQLEREEEERIKKAAEEKRKRELGEDEL